MGAASLGRAAESMFWRSFWSNATELLAAAENTPDEAGSDLDVFIGHDGQIHLRMNQAEEPLACLKAHFGARMAYRVSRQDHSVRVEGRAGSRTCLFEAAKPDGAARFLLANRAYRHCAAPGDWGGGSAVAVRGPEAEPASK